MKAMCDRSQMFESLIYERSKAVFEYSGYPTTLPHQLEARPFLMARSALRRIEVIDADLEGISQHSKF
jgi:hypothetical protein